MTLSFPKEVYSKYNYLEGDEHTEPLRAQLKQARKSHICSSCGKEIVKGDFEIFQEVSAISNGYHLGLGYCYICLDCAEETLRHTDDYYIHHKFKEVI